MYNFSCSNVQGHVIDSAASKGVIHKNNAANKKSSLAKNLNALKAAPDHGAALAMYPRFARLSAPRWESRLGRRGIFAFSGGLRCAVVRLRNGASARGQTDDLPRDEVARQQVGIETEQLFDVRPVELGDLVERVALLKPVNGAAVFA